MLIKLALIICVICALNGAEALYLHEKITTNGGGQVECRTDTTVVQDWVDSTGNQTYSRVLNQDMEMGTASLRSIYFLNKPGNVSPKNKPNNASPNTASIIQTINASPNTTSTNIIQMFIGTENITASEKNLKNDPPENNAAQYSALQEGNVQKDTKEQDSINKKSAMLANYNYLPIYRRFSRVKSSSTEEFDRPFSSSEDYSSKETSQNHYGIRMNSLNRLVHEIDVSEADNFTADNTISFGDGQVTTDYNIHGDGILEGSVIESGPMGRAHSVAETRIEDSNFTIGSGVEDEAQIGEESDIDKLSKAVEKPEVGSEEKQNESNKVQYYGLLDNLTEYFATGEITIVQKGTKSGYYAPMKDLYWFTWEDISNNNNNPEELLGRLNDTLGYTWAINSSDGNASVKKINSNTIRVSKNKNTIWLKLSDDRTKLSLINESEETKIFNASLGDYDKRISIYIPTPSNNNTASNQAAPNTASNQTDSVAASGQKDPVIGLIFGAPVNSTYIDRTITNSDYNTKTVYLGRYKPLQDKVFGKVTPNYTLNLTEGMFEFENVTAKGPKQRYLDIGYEGNSIKISRTPPGARFRIYKGEI